MIEPILSAERSILVIILILFYQLTNIHGIFSLKRMILQNQLLKLLYLEVIVTQYYHKNAQNY